MAKPLVPKDKVQQVLLSKRKINPITDCWECTNKPNKKSRYVELSINGTRILAHRLAAYVWLDFDYTVFSHKTKTSVCHKCDNRICINPAHLFIGDYRDNVRDCVRKGRANKRNGEKINTAKLQASQILEIVEWCKQGLRLHVIAEKYNVTPTVISNILKGKSWKHVPRKHYHLGRGCFSKQLASDPTWNLKRLFSRKIVESPIIEDSIYIGGTQSQVI